MTPPACGPVRRVFVGTLDAASRAMTRHRLRRPESGRLRMNAAMRDCQGCGWVCVFNAECPRLICLWHENTNDSRFCKPLPCAAASIVGSGAFRTALVERSVDRARVALTWARPNVSREAARNAKKWILRTKVDRRSYLWGTTRHIGESVQALGFLRVFAPSREIDEMSGLNPSARAANL